MRDVFRAQGKEWNERVKNEVKMKIAEHVAKNPTKAIEARQKTVFNALVKVLEQRLEQLTIARS